MVFGVLSLSRRPEALAAFSYRRIGDFQRAGFEWAFLSGRRFAAAGFTTASCSSPDYRHFEALDCHRRVANRFEIGQRSSDVLRWTVPRACLTGDSHGKTKEARYGEELETRQAKRQTCAQA